MTQLDLCRACGAARGRASGTCARCKHDVGPSLAITESPEEAWVAVDCTFTCRMCAFAVPLDHVDMDGGVTCGRCGLEQAFEVSAWFGALGFAHGVADLHADRGGGLAPDLEDVGVGRTSVAHAVDGPNALRVTVSPGRPLCESCKAPLDVTVGEGREATLACGACGTSARYTVPSAALSMTKGALRAVVAAEHRSDRAPVKVASTEGAIAIQCPSCSAALPAADGTKFVTCTFCKTVSRIPDRLWSKLSGKEPVGDGIWMLFAGPSPMRAQAQKERERERRSAEQQADLRAEKAARDAEHARQRAERVEAERLRKERSEADKREREEQRARERESEGRQKFFVALGSVLLIGVVSGIVVLTAGDKKKSGGASTASAAAVTTPKLKPPPPPPATHVVPACHCTSRAASGKNTFDLEAPAKGKSTWQIDWTQQSGFMTSNMPFLVKPGAGVLPPPAGTTTLALAVACDGSVLALANEHAVTAWAGDEQGVLWSTELPAARVLGDAGAPAPVDGSELAVGCTPLAVDDGAFTLALVGGKRITLAMKDGKPKPAK